MYIIRDVFIARPGQASKFAKMMKESMNEWGGATVKIMTDLVSEYNKVVIESEFEHLAEFEKMMADYKSGKGSGGDKKMEGYTEMYLTGRREIYQTVD